VDPEYLKSKQENISLINIKEWNHDENVYDRLYKEIENKLKSEKFRYFFSFKKKYIYIYI